MKIFDFSFLWKKQELREPNLYKELELGAQAKFLIESPAYERAVTRIRQHIHEQWATSPVRDTEGQTMLRLKLKVLDELESYLHNEAMTGEMASKQIDDERKREERKAA